MENVIENNENEFKTTPAQRRAFMKWLDKNRTDFNKTQLDKYHSQMQDEEFVLKCRREALERYYKKKEKLLAEGVLPKTRGRPRKNPPDI